MELSFGMFSNIINSLLLWLWPAANRPYLFQPGSVGGFCLAIALLIGMIIPIVLAIALFRNQKSLWYAQLLIVVKAFTLAPDSINLGLGASGTPDLPIATTPIRDKLSKENLLCLR